MKFIHRKQSSRLNDVRLLIGSNSYDVKSRLCVDLNNAIGLAYQAADSLPSQAVTARLRRELSVMRDEIQHAIAGDPVPEQTAIFVASVLAQQGVESNIVPSNIVSISSNAGRICS